jgi:hypothetical protein
MTVTETNAIDRLRDELHEYHVDVQKLVTRCESCRDDIVKLSSDVYGLPGNKEASPGLMGEVAELRGSRKRMVFAMRCVWGLLVALAGAITTAFLRSRWNS